VRSERRVYQGGMLGPERHAAPPASLLEHAPPAHITECRHNAMISSGSGQPFSPRIHL